MTKAAIIGLGTMGPGIAATLSRAGISVRCFDANADQCASAAPRFQAAAVQQQRRTSDSRRERGARAEERSPVNTHGRYQ